MSKFIKDIRQLNEKFSCMRLEKALYHSKSETLDLNFLLSVHFDEEDCKLLQDYMEKQLPFVKVNTTITKTVCDCDIVKKRIMEFISSEYLVVKDRIKEKDINAERIDEKVHITLSVEEEVCGYLLTTDFFDGLDEYLHTCFCDKFVYEYNELKNKERPDILAEEKVDYARIEQIPARYFKVNAVTRLFDNNDTNEVMYIQDALERSGEIAIAGKIISIREKETKKGKPFYIIDFNDGTGRMSGTVFSTKEIIRKMEKLQEGCEVVAVGKADVTSEGYHRFTISSLNLCELPKDFVYEERASRKPPESYLLVHPTPVEEIKQTDMFSMVNFVPDCLKGKTFVVFDFETTGTMPQEDKVTEIGAVKMVDGKIIEKFSTMVNPERKIPEVVVNLTGITDEMVADAPKFEEVAGDFYKFCHGADLVAHNIQFDYNFLRNLSKPINYIYNNRGIDTLELSRQVLPSLNNHKLDTVCNHFGIEFLHHRAYCDALATAQMFIELVKLKGKLPDYNM